MRTTIIGDRFPRRLMALVAIGSMLVAGAAFAVNVDYPNLTFFKSGFWVMPGSLGAQATTTNKVTRMLAGSETFTFTSQTITTQDTTGVTITGAQVGDDCGVGQPAAPTANAGFTCYVSAANTVKGRFHPSGTAANPGSTTLRYYIRSNQ